MEWKTLISNDPDVAERRTTSVQPASFADAAHQGAGGRPPPALPKASALFTFAPDRSFSLQVTLQAGTLGEIRNAVIYRCDHHRATGWACCQAHHAGEGPGRLYHYDSARYRRRSGCDLSRPGDRLVWSRSESRLHWGRRRCDHHPSGLSDGCSPIAVTLPHASLQTARGPCEPLCPHAVSNRQIAKDSGHG